MSDISPIEQLRVDNIGGSYYLELCDFKLVPNYRPKNRVVDVDIQTNPANWVQFKFTKNTLLFRETVEYNNGIEYYITELSAIIPKDRPDLLQNFKKLRASRWVGILHNRNGQQVVLGGIDTPLIFQLKERNYKRKVNQRNEYEVRFFVKKTSPSPHYLPQAAGTALWSNGNVMTWQNGNFIQL